MNNKDLRILLVSDNRPSANWGCRATTTALLRILRGHGTVFDTIGNDIKKKEITSLRCATAWPRWLPDARLIRGARNVLTADLFQAVAKKCTFPCPDERETSQRLMRYAAGSPVYQNVLEKIGRADVVVVNGEGDFILDRTRLTQFFLLALILIAKDLKKPVFVVNSMVSDSPHSGRDPSVAGSIRRVLSHCDSVLVRDLESLRILREIGVHGARYCPDALFDWAPSLRNIFQLLKEHPDVLFPFPHDGLLGTLTLDSDYVCVGGSSLAPRLDRRELVSSYCRLVQLLHQHGVQCVLVESCHGDHFIREVAEVTGKPYIPVEVPLVAAAAVLENARVFISGRFHPSVMASAGGVPLVCLSSNSHKMLSLQETLECEERTHFSVATLGRDAPQIVEACTAILSRRNEEASRLTNIVSTFSPRIRKEYDRVFGEHTAIAMNAS